MLAKHIQIVSRASFTSLTTYSCLHKFSYSVVSEYGGDIENTNCKGLQEQNEKSH